ncbi:hypothetical protein F4680DRAFT_199552 [Xylaria scruposa]|nr:hypothetical protein F4680DRAFT_199552 [Xylaria scruposa]
MASSPSHVSTPKKEKAYSDDHSHNSLSSNDSSEPRLWSSPPQGNPPSSRPSSSPPFIPSSEPKPSSSAESFLSGHIASEPTLPGPHPSALVPSTPTDNNNDVQRAYEAIADLFHDRYGPVSSNPSFYLNEELFLKLRQQLEDHNLLEYFDGDLRYDWVLGILTLRIMPETHIHSTMAGDLTTAINRELDRLVVAHPALLGHRQEIYDGYTGSIRSSTFVDRKSPDGQFRYGPDELVTFLVEVSDGQHNSSLKRKVQEYFESMLSVETILGIDITAPQPAELRYRRNYTHTARAILWAIRRSAVPNTEDQILTLSDTYFCWTGGRIVPGVLTIPFKLFLPLQHRDGSPAQAQAVGISHNRLVQMLRRGERWERAEMQQTIMRRRPCSFA